MATLGKTDIGGTSGPMSFNNEWAAGPYTASENGTITSISIYANSVGGGSTRFGVWKDDGTGNPGELVAESASSTLASGWMTFSASGVIEAGESYYIGHLSNNSLGGVWGGTAKEIVYKAKTFGNLSNPFPSSGTSTVGSRDYSMYFTYDPAPAESLTINTPITKQLIQRNPGEETADIEISGIAVGIDGAIEARFAGGAWATIDTIDDPGAFSGVLANQALAKGTLEVRFVNNTAVNDSVTDLYTGRLYLVTGDSIAQGSSTNAQNRNSVDAVVYRQDDAWIEADDPVDTLTSNGSHWPLLAQHLTSHFDCPIGFITTATGSRDIAGGNSDYAKPNVNGWGIMTSQYAEATDRGVEAFLVHLGPNAGVGDTLTQAQYLAALTQWASDIRADIQANVPIYLGVYGRSINTLPANPKIRRAIAEAIKANIFTCGPNLLGPSWSDGVHPKTDSEVSITAARWFIALTGVRAPRILRAELRSDPKQVDLVVSGTLGGSNGDTYTAALFTVNSVVPTSATRINSSRIRLVFAADRALGQAFIFAPGEEHVGATLPKSVAVNLPVTIHSISSEAQPIDPVQLSLVRPRVASSEIVGPVISSVNSRV